MIDNGISYIGNKLKIGIYGASHAEKIGVKIEGFPKGVRLDFDKIAVQMARRAPGDINFSTARKEPDIPQIISGVTDGVTDGGTIEAVIYNTNQHSKDYSALQFTPRPGHADYTAYEKFGGELDMRGGGKFSGRLTAPYVFAGALCRQVLESMGIIIAAHVSSIYDVTDDSFDTVNPDIELMKKLNTMTFPVINRIKKEQMLKAIDTAKRALDSIGGTVECMAVGLPVGLGDSLFDGVEGKLAPYLFGIPAVKGVQFGCGFGAATMHGSQHNDPFIMKDGKVQTETNNCGGILGGITNGMPLVFTVAFKPTPSIAREQRTVDLQTMSDTTLCIKGRHDPCVVPRGAAVVEAAASVGLLDLMMENGKIV
ncbi:MAG: chorismate synthase [Acutalibacteraceae bacterium]